MNIKEIIEKNNVNTPAHIIDLNQIYDNFRNIDFIKEKTGVKIFLALKGFSNDRILRFFINKLDGVSSSGLFESKLGKELNSKVSTFSTAYKEEDIQQICMNTEYIIFNSKSQYERYLKQAQDEECSIGIRINPEYTELPKEFGANTCKEDSHLGIKKDSMPSIEEFREGRIEGLHLHTMCEQGADTLGRTIEYLMNNYDTYLDKIKWINLGGGQLLGANNYDTLKAVEAIRRLKNKYNIEIILEPCEGIMINSGYYVTNVIDLLNNNIDIAIVDGSAICHMPDSVYRGWTKDMIDEDEKSSYKYKIVGCSCYAGDIFGTYYLNKRLKINDTVIFKDVASYTMVKNNMFNGIPFPNLYVIDLNGDIQKIKEYDYDCFKIII